LPTITRLEQLSKTEFVATIENPISETKNTIYAPAFLFAWEKIKEELKSPVVITEKNTLDFRLLNESKSHKGSLTEDEYSAEAEIIGDGIIAKAFFNKTLPFEKKLQILDEPIELDSTKVSAFGMYYYDEEIVQFTDILYYKDDDHYILKLKPKDGQHEIILIKGLEKYQTLKEAIEFTDDWIAQGKKEQAVQKNEWKYRLNPEDVFSIPIIQFNIETNYKKIEGQTFKTSNNKDHFIAEAYQRTGFIFNENGAVVESEAVIIVDSVGTETIIQAPKKMVFNQPFLVLIKRTNQKNPYFILKVMNSELLKRK
jgi:hypothetical protein